MAWAASLRKVEQRADDVREAIRSAGTATDEQQLAAIVRHVADRTGLPVSRVAAAAGIKLDQ